MHTLFVSGNKLYQFISLQEYLQAASSYIRHSTEATVSIEDIRGIWVSSDDESVISDVTKTFPEFFPNVEIERVVWISGRSFTNDMNTSKGPLATSTKSMVRGDKPQKCLSRSGVTVYSSGFQGYKGDYRGHT